MSQFFEGMEVFLLSLAKRRLFDDIYKFCLRNDSREGPAIMPLFVYRAIQANGPRIHRRDYRASRARKNYAEICAYAGFLVKRGWLKKRGSLFSFRTQSVSSSEFLQWNQELITLLKAGLTIPETLDLTAERPDSPVLAALLKKILDEVRDGKNKFSTTCAQYPKFFDGLYISSLKTGERTGDLSKPLLRYQEFLRQKVALGNKISQAMVYPIFLLSRF